MNLAWNSCLIRFLLSLSILSAHLGTASAQQGGSRGTIPQPSCRPPLLITTLGGQPVQGQMRQFEASFKPGDTLWASVKLTNPAFIGSSVRIDLISPYFSISGARLISMQDISEYAWFRLPDTLSEGPYCLRAYLIWDDLKISGSVRSYFEVLNPEKRPQDSKLFRQSHAYWMRKTGLKNPDRRNRRSILPSVGGDSCTAGRRAYVPHIEGRVLRDLVSVPVEDADVSLVDLNEYYSLQDTRTDASGNFRFVLDDIHDSAQIVIEAFNKRGQKSYVLEVEAFDPPAFAPDTIMLRWFSGKFEGKAYYTMPVRRDSMRTSVHGRADLVLYPDPGSAGRYSSILDYLDGRAPGVEIEGAGADRMAIIRGNSSIYGSSEALYLIDDVPASRQSVNALNPADVQRVEVIRNPSGMAMYGMRGGNGVIAIYTRRGTQGSFGEIRMHIIGFHEAGTPPIEE